mmetsp:Transcript_9482/g.16890  ORF Transcript_9482/g.16890 Transcript_9482/m.16890 type:complete len:164 (-) Transcript_9482:1618-2109(-)
MITKAVSLPSTATLTHLLNLGLQMSETGAAGIIIVVVLDLQLQSRSTAMRVSMLFSHGQPQRNTGAVRTRGSAVREHQNPLEIVTRCATSAERAILAKNASNMLLLIALQIMSLPVNLPISLLWESVTYAIIAAWQNRAATSNIIRLLLLHHRCTTIAIRTVC